MGNDQMLSLILVTVCVVIFSSLTLPVFCSYLNGDLSQDERTQNDFDYFDDIGNFGLYPHDRFPSQMNGDENDPFNRYMDNVFDSLPEEAPTIFDALRLSAFPDSTDLLDNDDDDDEDDDDNKNNNDKKNNKSSTTTTTSKAPPSKEEKTDHDQRESTKGKKQDTTKSKVEKLGRKIIGALKPIKVSTTPQTSTTSESNAESDGDKESDIFGNDEGDDSYDEKKWRSSTTTTSHGNPLFRWWSKMKSTSPKGTQKSATTELYEKSTTKKCSTPFEDDKQDDDNGDDENDDSDVDLISSTTPLPNIQSSKSTTTLKATSLHGKGKISKLTTTNESQPGKSTTPTSSTTPLTTPINTNSTTESDFLDELEDSIEKHSASSSSSSTTTTVKSTKRPKSTTITSSSTLKTTVKDGNENAEVEMIDPYLSGNVDSEFEHLKNTPTTMSTSTKKHKHVKASTPSTPVDSSSWSTTDHDMLKHVKTTAESDENSSKKSSTTQEPETTRTTKSTTDLTINDPDTFPVIPIATVKTIKSATTSRPGPTAQGHKTSRHSTSTTKSIKTTTIIPTLHPYIEDLDSEDDLFSSDWNPDLFP